MANKFNLEYMFDANPVTIQCYTTTKLNYST